MKRKSCRVQPFHKKSHTILFYASMFLFTLILILPFIYVVDASFQNEWAIKIGAVKVFPAAVTLQNYKDLLLESVGVTAFRENLFNSIKISFGVTTLSVVIGVLGAYGLSRYEFKGKEKIAKLMLFMYVFPTILAIYPIYDVLASMHLIDTHFGVILVHTALVRLLLAGVHDIDILRAAFGEPEKVSYSDIWDDGNMLMAELDYGNHVKAIFEVGYTNQKWFDEELTAYGLDQTITVKFPHPYIRNCPTIIKIIENKDGRIEEREVSVAFDEAFRNELLHFYQCVIENKQPETNIEEGKKDIRLLNDIFQCYARRINKC